MVKHINIYRKEDNNISIAIDNEDVICIEDTKKEILASDIFKVFSSCPKETYEVSKKDTGKEDQVLSYFFELFFQIAQKINQIQIDDEI